MIDGCRLESELDSFACVEANARKCDATFESMLLGIHYPRKRYGSAKEWLCR